jgi:hypothetical protein
MHVSWTLLLTGLWAPKWGLAAMPAKRKGADMTQGTKEQTSAKTGGGRKKHKQAASEADKENEYNRLVLLQDRRKRRGGTLKPGDFTEAYSMSAFYR